MVWNCMCGIMVWHYTKCVMLACLSALAKVHSDCCLLTLALDLSKAVTHGSFSGLDLKL